MKGDAFGAGKFGNVSDDRLGSREFHKTLAFDDKASG
jgi:hypothetical protein